MKEEFDRRDLAANIADELGLETATVLAVLEKQADILAGALSLPEFEHRVEIHHFGVLRLEHRAARTGHTPDGTEWATPERYEVVFHAAPAFSKRIAEMTGTPTY